MTSRLLVAALLLCPLTALAQIAPAFVGPISTGPVVEPVDLSQPLSAPLHRDAAQRLAEATINYKAESNPRITTLDTESDHAMVISPFAPDSSGNFCLKIRSYVVARDSKDSESTHLVRSSTCQPASRYGLKSIEARPDSSGH